jgi:predicted nucleic acid-binding protein
MMLCDTGPMVAMVDRDDPYHKQCLDVLSEIPPDGFVATWPCVAEAMYLLGTRMGFRGQDQLWNLVDDQVISVDLPEEREWLQMRELMQRYQDTPMDLADASIVTAAERLDLRRVFTLDKHFYAYRIRGRHPFEVVP